MNKLVFTCALMGAIIASALIIFFIISDFMQIDSGQLIPSHASNGEVEFIVHMKDDIESFVSSHVTGKYLPDLTTLKLNFDKRNFSGMHFIDNEEMRFVFDESAGIIWSGMVEVPVDSNTKQKKSFKLELYTKAVKNEEWGKVHYTNGTLTLGEVIWTPITAIYVTTRGGTLEYLQGFSHIDYYPEVSQSLVEENEEEEYDLVEEEENELVEEENELGGWS